MTSQGAFLPFYGEEFHIHKLAPGPTVGNFYSYLSLSISATEDPWWYGQIT